MNPAQAPTRPPESLHTQLPTQPMALIAPLLSGLSFLAMHGYQRRGPELSIACRFPHGAGTRMTLEVSHEGARHFELEGIAFRVEVDGERQPARLVTLNRSGIATLEEIPRMSRVLITLAPER